MGYRSDVRSLIYGPPEEINALLTATRLEGKQSIIEELKEDGHVQVYEYTGLIPASDAEPGREETFIMINLRADDVKWYPSYDFVDGWGDLIRAAGEFEKINYEYLRAGEDPADVEHETSVDAERYLFTSTHIVDDDVPAPIPETLKPKEE